MTGTDEVESGRMLARLREERGLSVMDIAQRLKYGARQIEALEAGAFDKLPGATFVRGMIRGYAKLLEVDAQPMLKAFERNHAPADTSMDLPAKHIPFPENSGHGTRWYLGLSLLALVVALGVLYEMRIGIYPWSKNKTSAPAAPSVSPEPAPVPVAQSEPRASEPVVTPPAAAHAPGIAASAKSVKPALAPVAPVVSAAQGNVGGGQGRVRMEFDSESWVEIKDGEGKTLMSQLNPSGSTRVVVGQLPLSLVIGNAAAVRLTYKDKPVDLKPHIQVEVARLTLN